MTNKKEFEKAIKQANDTIEAVHASGSVGAAHSALGKLKKEIERLKSPEGISESLLALSDNERLEAIKGICVCGTN
jgi:hypothetical protein